MTEQVQGKPFVMFDKTLVHKGGQRRYEDWDFLCNLSAEPDSPLNWLAPVNYADGLYLVRLEVQEMQEAERDVVFGIGWCNFTLKEDPTNQHRCCWPVRFKKPGVYIGGSPMWRMWNGPGKEDAPTIPWDWTGAFDPDSMFTLFQPDGQDPFPIRFRVTMTIIPECLAGDPFFGLARPEGETSSPVQEPG